MVLDDCGKINLNLGKRKEDFMSSYGCALSRWEAGGREWRKVCAGWTFLLGDALGQKLPGTCSAKGQQGTKCLKGEDRPAQAVLPLMVWWSWNRHRNTSCFYVHLQNGPGEPAGPGIGSCGSLWAWAPCSGGLVGLVTSIPGHLPSTPQVLEETFCQQSLHKQ